MTNKLPEIGKRYRRKGFESFEIEIHRIVKDSIGIMIVTKCERVYSLSNFFELFKEIPDQDLNRSNNTQLEDDRFADVGKMIEEAKDQLKEELKEYDKLPFQQWYNDNKHRHDSGTCPIRLYISLVSKAQSLLDSLDAQKEPKLTDKKVCQSNRESIYSGVSELRELFKHIHDQNFSPELITYLEIILDQQEQNTKDIAEMKERTTELENREFEVLLNGLDESRLDKITKRIEKLEQLIK